MNSVGYLETGHRQTAGLQEVRIENSQTGKFQNSDEARAAGGIVDAGTGPAPSAKDDWSSISLVGRPGPNTWPLVSISFVNVRNDLTYMQEPNEQTLLVAFLKALYDPSYISGCENDFKVTGVVGGLKEVALDGIQNMITSEEATDWIFEEEDNTLILKGAGDHVFSAKRGNAYYEHLDRMDVDTTNMRTELTAAKDQVTEVLASLSMVEKKASLLIKQSEYSSEIEYTMYSNVETTLALVFTFASMGLWIIFVVVWFLRRCVFGIHSTEAATVSE